MSTAPATVVITVRYAPGCPNWRSLDAQLRDIARQHEGVDVRRERVDTAEQAQGLGFAGSPTVLIDGRDPFADDEARVGLSCRLYATPEGLRGAPDIEDCRRAIAAAVDRDRGAERRAGGG